MWIAAQRGGRALSTVTVLVVLAISPGHSCTGPPVLFCTFLGH
jgi:hypothetical protein